MVEKRVHFVCRGNIYRSRLAEAYAKSLKLPGYVFTSSGVETDTNPHTLLSPFARDVARTRRLTAWLSKHKVQTTSELLKNQDIIVLMSKDVFDAASTNLNFDASKATVWGIKDLDTHFVRHKISKQDAAKAEQIVGQTARAIIERVDALLSDLRATSWSDVYDEHNKPLGYKLPIAWVCQRKGLWRRSAHAVVTTANKRYVIEKRAENIVFSPNMLDISLGGSVDSGEAPRQAIMREIREELGVKVHPEQVTFLKIHKFSAYHPKYKKYTQSFAYTYHVALTIDNPIFILQTSEVREVRLLTLGQVRRLLRVHSLRRVGRLNYSYKYYADIVKRAKMYVK
jgi:protein-tyrosine-phosphatase/8-oxo-dGTP pyrophosphatase MutT (NUDIX family)